MPHARVSRRDAVLAIQHIEWRIEWCIGSLLLLALSGCAAPQTFRFRQLVMGVEANVTLVARDEATAVEAARAAFARMNELDQVMSDYRDDSEVIRLSQTHGEAVRVSDDLMRVLTTAQEVRAKTGGAFDVTLGPLTLLWREARKSGHVPDQMTIDAARIRCGGDAMIVDSSRHSVTLTIADMRLDLGGIGKGFAAEEALRTLSAHGCPQALVALAGDIRAGDAPPDKRGWTIHVGGDGTAHVELVNASISTSGEREQFIEIDGVRHSHVLDPRSGFGASTHIEVTVIGPNGATVDALSSAMAVLGFDQGGTALSRSYPAYAARFKTTFGNARFVGPWPN